MVEPDVLLLHSPAKFMAGVDGNAPSSLVLETGRHPYGTPILAETEGLEPSVAVLETAGLPVNRRSQ